MTEAELWSQFWISQEMVFNSLTLYITIFSAYVMVAYLIGEKLTRIQSIFISSAYKVFTLLTIWGTYAYFSVGYITATLIEDPEYEILLAGVNPTYVAVPLLLVGMFGALIFMWKIRSAANPE